MIPNTIEPARKTTKLPGEIETSRAKAAFLFAALFSGSGITFSLAPFNIWPLGFLSCGLFSVLLFSGGKTFRFWLPFCFGLGLYSTGVSWVYVSINDFGASSTPLAIALTSIFVIFLAFVFSLPYFFFNKYFNKNILSAIVVFSAVWCLNDWIRSWIFTGFPWLYPGYAHVDTWLAAWSPITGIFGYSFFIPFMGSCLTFIVFLLIKRERLFDNSALNYCSAVSLALLVIPVGLKNLSWTETKKTASGEEIFQTATLVQPNIPQAYKWNPQFDEFILRRLYDFTDSHWDSDIIVWPEASVPTFYHRSSELLKKLDEQAKETNTTFIGGILFDDINQQTFYNAIAALGNADGIYFKQRLVPFGEYVPLEEYLRGLIAFFNLPTSIISAGDDAQTALGSDQLTIAASICYEIVYPDLIREYARDANVLVTISNDAWFGKSIGPIQHFQMARMRALENGKYLLRATNNGTSGIVSDKGKVIAKAPSFEAASVTGQVPLKIGSTPFAKYGSSPVIWLSTILLILGVLNQRRARKQGERQENESGAL